MPFYDLDARTAREIFTGITTRTFWGENLLLSYVTFEPHAQATAHNHPHEQAGVIISGMMDMTIGDETRTLRPGEIYLAPGGVMHAVKAGADGCVALEIFSPVRELLQY